MRTNEQIRAMLDAAGTEAARLALYRSSTSAVEVKLPDDMAAALGSKTGRRRIVPVLGAVVDAIANKLEMNDGQLKSSKVRDTKALTAWLGDAQWSQVERQLYPLVVRDGYAFLLTRWMDGAPRYDVIPAYNGLDGAGAVEVDGDLACTFNTWRTDGTAYLDVYLPDAIEKYIRVKDGQWTPRRDTPDESWPIPWVDTDGTPLGIALTRFQIDGSAIASAVQIGQDLNEAILDMLATSRLQGWPQRYLKGQKNPGVILNETGQPIISPVTGRPFQRTIQATPGSIMFIGADAELGQLDGAQPGTAAIDKLLELLSFITTVPSHYFTGQWPSGVALIQAESRMNHRVEGYQGALTPSILAVLRLTMRLSNLFGNTGYDAGQDITIGWYSPQVETEDLRIERQKATTDNVTKLYGANLMSLKVAIRTLHPDWSEDEVQAEVEELKAARASQSALPVAPKPAQEQPKTLGNMTFIGA